MLRGELTFPQFALCAYLVLAKDDRDEVATTLSGLAEAIGWPQSLDSLLRAAQALRNAGWLDYESKTGQRKPYVIRLTGLLVETSDTTSATKGGGFAEVTSAVPRSDGVAKQVIEPAEPPHDLRSAEVLRREEKKKKDVVDEAFEIAIEPLGYLTSPQRAEAFAAWLENPDGVRRCVADALQGDRPAALFMTLIRDGAHRLPAVGSRPSLVDVLKNFIRNEGRHYIDWSICEDEISRNEERRQEKLASEERQELFELWDSLREETTW